MMVHRLPSHARSGGAAGATAAAARLAALGALVLAVFACFSGSSRNVSQPTGPTGIGGGGGGGTGGGGGGGASYAGTYRLQTINDSTLPFVLAHDSASGIGPKGDTIRVFKASFDSSFISLNSDTTAREIDYLTISDDRTASDSSFQRDNIAFGDTTAGSYTVRDTTVQLTRTDTVGGAHSVVMTYSGSGGRLQGTVAYSLFNTDDQLVTSGSAVFVYQRTGPPLHGMGGGSGAAAERITHITHVTRAQAAGAGSGQVTGAAGAWNPRAWRPPVSAALRAPMRAVPGRTRP